MSTTTASSANGQAATSSSQPRHIPILSRLAPLRRSHEDGCSPEIARMIAERESQLRGRIAEIDRSYRIRRSQLHGVDTEGLTELRKLHRKEAAAIVIAAGAAAFVAWQAITNPERTGEYTGIAAVVVGFSLLGAIAVTNVRSWLLNHTPIRKTTYLIGALGAASLASFAEAYVEWTREHSSSSAADWFAIAILLSIATIAGWETRNKYSSS